MAARIAGKFLDFVILSVEGVRERWLLRPAARRTEPMFELSFEDIA